MNTSLFYGRRNAAGTTLMEVLTIVMIIGVLSACAVVLIMGPGSASKRIQLTHKAASLNRALTTFKVHGGVIPPDATADAVFAALKSSSAASQGKTHPGLRGSMVDVTLRPVAATPGSGEPRIVWDAQSQMFLVSSSGAGWRGFERDSSAGGGSASARRASLPFASEDQWVWDYADAAIDHGGPGYVPGTSPEYAGVESPAPPQVILPPLINPASGIYDYRSYPMTVTITDPNPPGTARVYYRMEGESWRPWSGVSLTLPRDFFHSVEAYADARDGESAPASATVRREYHTYFIRGVPQGEFTGPLGESRFEHTLSGDLLEFTWGRAESPGQNVSSLTVAPAPLIEAGPGESFTVATLTYANGVSRAGTNARGIRVALSLPLSAPSGVTLNLELPLRIENSIHYPWVTSENRRDYLWVPAGAVFADTLVVHDRTFRIQLFASSSGAEPDGHELRIPIEEDGTAEVALHARLDPH